MLYWSFKNFSRGMSHSSIPHIIWSNICKSLRTWVNEPMHMILLCLFWRVYKPLVKPSWAKIVLICAFLIEKLLVENSILKSFLAHNWCTEKRLEDNLEVCKNICNFRTCFKICSFILTCWIGNIDPLLTIIDSLLM